MAHTDTNTIEIIEAPATAITVHDGDGVQWGAILEAWQGSLKSERTKTEYRRYVAQFAAMLQDHGKGLEDATAPDVHTFAYARLPNPRTGVLGVEPSAAAVNVRLAAIRSLYAFVIRLQQWSGPQIIRDNPADAKYVQRPAIPQPKPKGIGTADVAAFLEAARNGKQGKRDYAMMLTMILTGMRRSELLRLTAGNLGRNDDGTPMYRVIVKGGHERYREMDTDAYAAITAYLQADGRPLESLPDDARIFPITAKHLYTLVSTYAKQIGHPGLSVHGLRHSAAKLQRKAGATLEEVQAFLGHASVATTARYLQALEGEKDTHGRAVMGLIRTAGKGTANE